ncbi:hypothetical protein [Intrasporangium calvum]|uniref:Polyketide cyclase/dehydrase n=1 Tax=Intrasporangium calvum (strain ATCC 23552 / DSM 43043 / JCM 3097 / NBRC 12989 / NCIMB 10167 / NRRL B-3866 / 7 KIP) TaxID=710696 RepID=E6SFD9_INTC7|nr:hypothetical protein [Intrasporangium calvum]ADU46677.1 hypothetical protein Intca_0116 [Intrasporangium calvum DSM 43043]AXG15045.1 hypothetical protein DN585_17955 [Intrasporangium calvum]
MPQVSADAHVPLPPDAAAAVAESFPPARPRVPPHVRSVRAAWRFRPEGAGALAIHTISYAAGPAWLARLAHEPTQWLLRHQAVRQVERLAEVARSRVRDA